MTVVDRFVQAVSHGGLMKKPTLIVIHSAETPLRAGYAKSIAENWFGRSATTSAHYMVDPVETIRMLSDNVVSYAVGPKANGFTINVEQAGYAKLSRAEWTTAEGRAQHRKVGALIRERAEANGIPLRWATDDQIRAAAKGVPGGVCFHNDIARVLGGTTHTDPIPNYPSDLVEQAWGGTLPEDELSAEFEKDARELLGALHYMLIPEGGWKGEQGAVINRIGAIQWLLANTDELAGKIAAAVVAQVPPGNGGGVTEADVADAVRTVLREGVA